MYHTSLSVLKGQGAISKRAYLHGVNDKKNGIMTEKQVNITGHHKERVGDYFIYRTVPQK